MGLIISRYRKKKSSEEILENLQKEIETFEERLVFSSERQRLIFGKLVIYLAILFILAATVTYFLFPSTTKERVVIFVCFIACAFLCFYTGQLLSWFYKRDITKSRDKLAELLTKKKKILEDVMDKETYKKAKEILDKYAPEQTRKYPVLQPPTSSKVSQEKKENGSQPVPVSRTPVVQNAQRRTPSPGRSPPRHRQLMPNMLVRPILPQDRSWMDKLIESLIGDGPNNRYALICQQCASHNGMALKEEFEYLAFRCAYCGFPNPSRKVRPRLSLGPGQSINRRLFDREGSPSRRAIEDSTSSDTESGVQIEEVTENTQMEEAKEKKEDPSKPVIEEEVIVPGELVDSAPLNKSSESIPTESSLNDEKCSVETNDSGNGE